LVWINSIRSYRREESEITLAASLRLGCNEPREGCLYAVHLKAGIGPITEGPIRAWGVEAIGPLEPGDSPDGSSQNPVMEGVDMLIGSWDWSRVEEHLRSGWWNIETQTPMESKQLSKWHLSTCKVSGEEMHLNVCKGTGIETSEIRHEAAAIAGLPQGSAYQVHVRGTRAGFDFHAKGVSVIRHTAARGARSGELPAWERPDVLLGKEDTKRLESYLHAGWRNAQETRKALPAQEEKRDVATTVCFGDEPVGCATIATARKATEKFGADFREAAWLLKHQAYVDDATARAVLEAEPEPAQSRGART
jgi:hypothetical protein